MATRSKATVVVVLILLTANLCCGEEPAPANVPPHEVGNMPGHTEHRAAQEPSALQPPGYADFGREDPQPWLQAYVTEASPGAISFVIRNTSPNSLSGRITLTYILIAVEDGDTNSFSLDTQYEKVVSLAPGEEVAFSEPIAGWLALYCDAPAPLPGEYSVDFGVFLGPVPVAVPATKIQVP